MEINSVVEDYELIFVIVNFGQGSKVLKLAAHNGVSGGTVFFGMGTLKNRILEFLELAEVRKEIVVMAVDKKEVDATVGFFDKEFHFEKPHHGIVFTISLPTLLAVGDQGHSHKKSGGNVMYNSIVVVVDKGKAEFVMDSATKAGARGGTIIKGRGAGAYETEKVFHMDIEPEKEIVLILSKTENVKKIVNSIRDRLEIDKAGHGVIFCMDVNKAYGLA